MDNKIVTKKVNLHPLFMNIILEQIFSSIVFKDLKSCRQVCKFWCEIASKKFQEVACVEIGRKKHRLDAKDFLELVSRDESTFIQLPLVYKYSIRGYKGHAVPREFWSFCGSSIKALELNGVQSVFNNSDECRYAIFICCQNLESLQLGNWESPKKTLHGNHSPYLISYPLNRNLKVLGFYGEDIFDFCRTEFLLQYPEIKDFSVCAFGGKIDKIFDTLKSKWSNGESWWPLQKLTFNFDKISDSERIVAVLGKKNISLESLHVRDLKCPLHICVLKDILSAHVSSLKHLKILSKLKIFIRDIIPVQNDRIFKCLESMIMIKITFSSINDLRFFPNIRKLELHACSFSYTFILDDEVDLWELDNCTELTIDLGINISVDKLQVLLKKLPNVEKLICSGCNNEQFSVVCGYLPKLVHLDLEYCTVDDSGLTGWDAEDIKEYFLQKYYWRPISVFRANISCLKHLKHLSLSTKQGKSLGLCGAICGVEQLPRLKSLRIVGQTSHPIWYRLCEKFPYPNY